MVLGRSARRVRPTDPHDIRRHWCGCRTVATDRRRFRLRPESVVAAAALNDQQKCPDYPLCHRVAPARARATSLLAARGRRWCSTAPRFADCVDGSPPCSRSDISGSRSTRSRRLLADVADFFLANSGSSRRWRPTSDVDGVGGDRTIWRRRGSVPCAGAGVRWRRRATASDPRHSPPPGDIGFGPGRWPLTVFGFGHAPNR